MTSDGYHPGLVEVVTEESLRDYYGDDWQENAKSPSVPYIQLPHMCDAWVIGGKEEVRALIRDLESAL